MNQEDFENYINNAIINYAKEKVKAGAWVEEESFKKSEQTFDGLLPNGVDTKDQYLYSLIVSDTRVKVGHIWFNIFNKLTEREAFIYDFVIFQEYRGKGYGTQSMAALEKEVKKLSIDKLSLHVFGHNEVAIKLYKKMGYEITDINMSKLVK